MRKIFLLLALIISALLLKLFVGAEVLMQEHDTKYSIFIKKHPSLKTFYQNTAQCGECDLDSLDRIKNHSEVFNGFTEYCRIKYDLAIEACYAKLSK